MRNLQEQVKKAFCCQKLFWPFTVWINCSSDLKIFANYQPSASNFKSLSWSLKHFFLIVGQSNFGINIPVLKIINLYCWIFSHLKAYLSSDAISLDGVDVVKKSCPRFPWSFCQTRDLRRSQKSVKVQHFHSLQRRLVHIWRLTSWRPATSNRFDALKVN